MGISQTFAERGSKLRNLSKVTLLISDRLKNGVQIKPHRGCMIHLFLVLMFLKLRMYTHTKFKKIGYTRKKKRTRKEDLPFPKGRSTQRRGHGSFTDGCPSSMGRRCQRGSVPGLSSWPGQQRSLGWQPPSQAWAMSGVRWNH